MNPKKLLIIGLIASTLSGCGQNSEPQTPDAPIPKAPLATNQATPEPPPTLEEKSEKTNKNSEYAYFIDVNFDKTNSLASIQVDHIDWLTSGQGPGTCSSQASSPNQPQCNPNGFLVVNSDPSIKTLTADANTSINLVDELSPDLAKTISLAELVTLINEEPADYRVFILKTNNDKILEITEQYRP